MMGFSSFLARVIRRVLIVGFAVTIAGEYRFDRRSICLVHIYWCGKFPA
jgi:hypothetical protein